MISISSLSRIDTRDSACLSSANHFMIHALPGMGADNRLFPSPWNSLPGFIAHDWPTFGGEETLASLALNVSEVCGIMDGDSVIGASLGGMVACEISRIRKIDSLYLIGSAIHPTEVSQILNWMHPLLRATPLRTIQRLARHLPSQLAQMFSEADPLFILKMTSAIFRWDGFVPGQARVIRIHGTKDAIIPPPKQADLLIDAGHFLSLSHAQLCVEFIKQAKSPPQSVS